jgi:thioredoxin 1
MKDYRLFIVPKTHTKIQLEKQEKEKTMKKLILSCLALAPLCSYAKDIQKETAPTVIILDSVEQFEKLLKDKDNPILIADFYAEWCGPCRQQEPILHTVAQKYSDIRFVKINVDKFGKLSEKYNVASIPTIIYFKDGKEDHRTVGVQKEATLRVALNDLKKADETE